MSKWLKIAKSQNEIDAIVEERVQNQLTPIGESEYDDMLDEIYDFKSVGGPFQYMLPSRVLKEVDPIAYRVGFSDWLDAESDRYEEIAGDYYDRDSVESIRDEVETEVENEESEAEDAESELDQAPKSKKKFPKSE